MEGRFVTIGSFPALVDLALVEALLREQDIPFRVLDANTVGAAPHLSPAIGGARLQVAEADAERAIWLLAEQGIAIDRLHVGSPLLEAFERRTARMPLLGLLPPGPRLLMIAIPVLILFVTGLFFLLRPSLKERVSGRWCVRSIHIDGRAMVVATRAAWQFELAGCAEHLRFEPSGYLQLPGFASRAIGAKWRVLRGDVVISEADTLADVLCATWSVRIQGDLLELTGPRAHITCERWRAFR